MKNDLINCQDDPRYINFVKETMIGSSKLPCLKKDSFFRKENPVPEKIKNLINSQFNLILDSNEKNELYHEIKKLDQSLYSQLIRSLFYLRVGNTSLSDQILRTMTEKSFLDQSFQNNYFSIEDFNKILMAFKKHPTDRKFFYLFVEYLSTYTTDSDELKIINQHKDIDFIQKYEKSYFMKNKMKNFDCFLSLKNKQTFSLKVKPFDFCSALFNSSLMILDQTIFDKLDWLKAHYPIEWVIMTEDDRLSTYLTKNNSQSLLKERHQLLKQMPKSVYRQYFGFKIGDWSLL